MDQSQESLAALTHFKTLLCFARVGARGLRLRRLFVPLSISDANRNGLAGMTEIHACRQECQFVLQVHFWILMSQMRTQHRHFITYVIPTGALDFTGCSIPWGVSCPCSRWFFGIIFSIEIFIRMVGWGPKPLALRLQRLRHGDSINGRYPNSWMVRNRNSYDNGWFEATPPRKEPSTCKTCICSLYQPTWIWTQTIKEIVRLWEEFFDDWLDTSLGNVESIRIQ